MQKASLCGVTLFLKITICKKYVTGNRFYSVLFKIQIFDEI